MILPETWYRSFATRIISFLQYNFFYCFVLLSSHSANAQVSSASKISKHQLSVSERAKTTVARSYLAPSGGWAGGKVPDPGWKSPGG